ncbi:MAG: DsrE family protein [Thermaerobacter sp.]|nr:DsrE family protein [Thermaerobacter sp.]
MGKIAFWITAGPSLQDKAMANLVLAGRLKTNRQQDVQVYFFGPGVQLAGQAEGALLGAISALAEGQVPMAACPANAEQYGLVSSVTEKGVAMEPAGEAMIRLVEQGYQIVGV